jgi:hypothetical protein
VVAHHLVVDGVSWRIMLEDVDALLRDTEPLPTTTGFVAWAERRAAYTEQQQVAAAAALAEMSSWPWRAVKTLPVVDSSIRTSARAADDT